jgi:predicted nucleic acid-binding Zn ribbon protein
MSPASSARQRREAAVSDDPVPVTEALDGLLRSLRGGAGRAEVGGVFGRWEEAVGGPIAAHVRPVRLEHGSLLVEVDEPAWATQVRLLSDDLRRRLLEVTGVQIDHVDVRVARTQRG